MLFAAVVVAGCGGNSHARRDAVNRYFDRVDAAQLQVRLQAGSIERALTHFSMQRNTKSETGALLHAQAVLERARVKVQHVQPPADARPLHADLVRLYGLQAGVAGELAAMTRFVPRYDAALAPLKPAHTTLAGELKVAKGWKVISRAFERYRLSLVAVVTQLDRLTAPPTMRPASDAERAALRRSAAICTSIEDALAKHDAKKTAAGINALSAFGRENAVAHARRQQVAAAKAYNARLAQIASLTAKIGKERDALVGELG
jgi:hypothetical protein